MSPRWHKVARDLRGEPARTGLLVLALALGSFGVGADLTAHAILSREIRASFASTRPPSLVLHLEGDATPELAAALVSEVPDVKQAEARGMIEARVEVAPDTWRRLLLFTVADFDHLGLSIFTRESGACSARSEC